MDETRLREILKKVFSAREKSSLIIYHGESMVMFPYEIMSILTELENCSKVEK